MLVLPPKGVVSPAIDESVLFVIVPLEKKPGVRSAFLSAVLIAF